ncbi:MAG TPA: hypothetical protein VMP08_13935 [Anaerolineae bacterium]|nr:hypothetical protein [Anaerolineae bacterium]
MKPSRLIALGGSIIGAAVVMALVLTAMRSPIVQAAPAATCTWTGGNGNWSDTSKWSCGLVPGASDSAVVANGTVTLDVPVSIGSLLLNSQITAFTVITEGVVTGNQPLTILNSLQWYGGKLKGSGLTTIDVNATGIISRQFPSSGSPDNGLQRSIWNRGVVSLTGGTVGNDGAPFATFTNTGTFNALNGDFYPQTFRNDGLFVKSSSGTASVGLSIFRNYGSLIVNSGYLGAANWTQFAGSTLLNGGTLSGPGRTFAVRGGNLGGSGTVVGLLQILISGTLSPGASPGAIQIVGDYQQLSGTTLNVEIGGHDLKDYDVLFVEGQAYFDSNTKLNISLINGYTPALIDGFSIVRYKTRLGTLTTVSNPIAATHPLSYTANAITLGNPQPRPFQSGDLFVSSTNGKIKQFDRDSNLVGVLDPKLSGNPLAGAGMCFDSNGNLIATQFGVSSVSKFNVAGQLISSTFGGFYGAQPESCAFDAAGNFFVGQANAIVGFPAPIQKHNGTTGAIMDVYTATQTDRGTDWIDLKADGRTILYTSEDGEILAYDVLSKTQKPNFVNGLQDPCFAIRVRPNGEVMVACQQLVYRFSSSGAISHTYTVASLGETDPLGLFALNLDSDGTSFWTAGLGSGKVYKVDIASGTLLKSFDAHPFVGTAIGAGAYIVGLAVYGEIQVGRPNLTLVETVGTLPASCAGTREITVGAGTTVYYCYTIINSGVVTLTTHSLTDTVIGPIFSNQAIALVPGATTFVTRAATINGTTINVATWSGTDGSQSASASDFTRVNVGIVLDKKVYLPLVRK